ncbi:cAMP-binding domain of CRP or a regulatory subunit of cAMP-dependent protein kinases [Chitinophaga jiangningensis]|uniref:cAMP-binding domain of CRP or a regulatory subunit of cAMP-dependent protein kinases n=1 Tax=Chitinophaga jiangningensis TaxID=1419482 RepID=A0A1M7M9F4_9BACT|nr:Crp/Fnr family transcriptional regulator [Chitinophaga jiangningensis]SHM87340.1 cAMP-binding domain of CRP or a regulatory subunit of cAMP-dependent protein kinases [Chitinophaga jiangningensis]
MRNHDPFELILANIGRHISLTPEESSYFTRLLKPGQYARKEFLLREGAVCADFTFIVSGCMKSYLLDQQGKEHILTFAAPDWWIADINSFISGKPGNLFIQAINDTITLALSRRNQEILLREIPQFERCFRILTERAFAASLQRNIDAMSLSAVERLEKFRQQYPYLLPLLSDQEIASYIGVTPSFFSRMLKKHDLK